MCTIKFFKLIPGEFFFTSIAGIKLSIKGISKTQWTSGKTQLTGCQKHFNQELFVLGREFGKLQWKIKLGQPKSHIF